MCERPACVQATPSVAPHSEGVSMLEEDANRRAEEVSATYLIDWQPIKVMLELQPYGHHVLLLAEKIHRRKLS